MDAIICPICGTDNRAGATNCTNCGVNLKLALKDSAEIERIKRESVVIPAGIGHGPEPRPVAALPWWAFWGLWMFATIVGLIISSLPLAVLYILQGDPAIWLVMILILPFAGACVGTGQWLVLRLKVPMSAEWIRASVLEFVDFLFGGRLSGRTSGQQALLEKHLRDAGDWRRTSVFAWLGALVGAGLLLFLRLASADGQPDPSIVGRLWTIELPVIVAGLIAGAITGIELVSLLDRPEI